MSTLEWKKVITLNTEKGKEVKIDLYVDSIQITLPNKDKILLEESDFHCFIGLLTDDE